MNDVYQFVSLVCSGHHCPTDWVSGRDEIQPLQVLSYFRGQGGRKVGPLSISHHSFINLFVSNIYFKLLVGEKKKFITCQWPLHYFLYVSFKILAAFCFHFRASLGKARTEKEGKLLTFSHITAATILFKLCTFTTKHFYKTLQLSMEQFFLKGGFLPVTMAAATFGSLQKIWEHFEDSSHDQIPEFGFSRR